MKIVSALLLIATVALIGCDDLQGNHAASQSAPQKSTPDESAWKTAPTSPKCSSDHRFERLEIYPMNLRADIALDSCTGRICRTWSWGTTENSPVGWKNHANDPLCSDLLISNP